MAKRSRSAWWGYVIALAATFLALLLNLLIGPLREQTPFPTFLAAVMVAMWVGGLWAGLLSTALATLSLQYFFLEPSHSLLIEGLAEMVRLSMFLAVALLILSLGAMQQRVRESEERHRRLVDNSLGLICLHDLEGTLLSVNRAAAHLLGYRPEEAVGQHIKKFIDPSVQHLFGDYLGRIRRNSADTGLMRVAAQDGMTRILSYHNVLCEEPGKAPYVLGHAQDVTELHRAQKALRKAHDELEDRVAERTADLESANRRLEAEIAGRRRAEDALRASQERYKELFENANALVYTHDLEGNVTSLNRMAEQISGYTREEAVDKNIADVLPPEYLALARRMIRQEITDKAPTAYEVEMVTKDGRRVPLEISSRLIYEGGRPAGVQAIAVDITERKRVEAVITEWKNRYEAAIQASGHILYDWDPQTNDVVWAGNHQAILGYSAAEMGGKLAHWVELVHPDDRAGFLSEIDRLSATRQPAHLEYRVRRKDGRHILVKDDGYFFFDPDGKIGRMVGFVADITERRQLEEQLRQSQKMEAIGKLAGGVAHDFNNLLTAIFGYSELLLETLGSAEPLRSEVEEIKKAAERAATLTRQLLVFSRRQMLQPKVLDLNAVLADVDRLLRRLIGEHIDLVVAPGSALGRVKADPGQIEQVILNLVLNARDAMPQGGKLTIETTNVELNEDYARVHSSQPGSYVMLAVSDTGCGMDEETRSHLFEPFFTTKPIGKGTGLGLSTVYGIVRQCGGHIWVFSQPGQGTTFKIYLPVAEPTTDAEHSCAAAASATGSETILLVEDDEAVRALVEQILQGKGYAVLAARDGTEAIGICGRHSGTIHLMLTDVVMPGIGGRDLFHRLSPSRPAMRVLYMSGYADNAVLHHGVLDPGTALIQKPFSHGALVRKVREVLDAASGT